jgi:hypothetical protein
VAAVQQAAVSVQEQHHMLLRYSPPLQARLAEEAERLAAQQRAATQAQEAGAAKLRAVQEDIDEETEQLKARCMHHAAATIFPAAASTCARAAETFCGQS